MNVKNQNQKVISAPLFVKRAEGYEFKGELFQDPYNDALFEMQYNKHTRNPYDWNYFLSVKGGKKLKAFCEKYVKSYRHGWVEIKEFLETNLSGGRPYCSFVDFNRLRNLQDTDDMKKGIRYSKATEELHEYSYEFEAVLMMAQQLSA